MKNSLITTPSDDKDVMVVEPSSNAKSDVILEKAKKIPTMGAPKNLLEEFDHIFLGTLFSIIDDIISEELPEIEVNGLSLKIPEGTLEQLHHRWIRRNCWQNNSTIDKNHFQGSRWISGFG